MIALEPPRPRLEEPQHPFAGQLVYQGVPIDVETPRGGIRSGVDPDGKPWRVRMPAHYGEVRGSVAADGDAVDVFVGDDPFAPFVWVVQTKNPSTGKFDEPKCMIGFRTREEALATFRQAYNRPIMEGVVKWPFGAWAAALQRPRVSSGRMDRPLTKAVISLAAWALRKAEQLSLFGGTAHVRQHVRHQGPQLVIVQEHERHVAPAKPTLTSRDAFRLKAHQLREHVEAGGESGAVAKAELDRREAKRGAAEASPPPTRLTEQRLRAIAREAYPEIAEVPAREPETIVAAEPPVAAATPAPDPEPAPAVYQGGQPPAERDTWQILRDPSSTRDEKRRALIAEYERVSDGAMRGPGTTKYIDKRLRSLAARIKQLGGFETVTDGHTWPPPPTRFKDKYTKDELKAITWGIDDDTSFGPLRQMAEQWERVRADSPGVQAVFGHFTPYGFNELPSAGIRKELQHIKDPIWNTVTNGDKDGFLARVYGDGVSLATPQGLLNYAEKFIAPRASRHMELMTTWGDPELYRRPQGPAELVARLQQHEDNRPGSVSYNDGLVHALMQWHGLPTDAFQRFHGERDKPRPADLIRHQHSDRPPLDPHELFDRQRQKEADERTESAARDRAYREGALELDTLVAALEQAKGESLTPARLRAKLSRGTLRRSQHSDGQSSYKLEGWTPGWIYNGPYKATSALAFAAFLDQVRQLADSAPSPMEKAMPRIRLVVPAVIALSRLAKADGHTPGTVPPHPGLVYQPGPSGKKRWMRTSDGREVGGGAGGGGASRGVRVADKVPAPSGVRVADKVLAPSGVRPHVAGADAPEPSGPRRWRNPATPTNLKEGERRNWTDRLDYLPDETKDHRGYEGTQKLHKRDDGSYTPARQALHQRILSHFLDHVQSVPEGEKPVAMVMMGGSASGKSTAVKKNLHVDDSKFVKLDADEVKASLPEYTHAVANSARNAAQIAHEESSDVMKQIRAKAMEQRKNIIMDGTGASRKNYGEFMQKLKEAGYHVHLVYCDIDKELAIPRAKERGEKTGRVIPDHFIEHAYNQIPHNFLPLKEHADEFTMFDTRGYPGRPVWTKHGGVETVHDQGFVDAFRTRYGTSGGEAMKKAVNPATAAKPNVSGEDVMKYMLESMKRDHEHHKGMPRKHAPGDGVTHIEDDKAFEA